MNRAEGAGECPRCGEEATILTKRSQAGVPGDIEGDHGPPDDGIPRDWWADDGDPVVCQGCRLEGAVSTDGEGGAGIWWPPEEPPGAEASAGRNGGTKVGLDRRALHAALDERRETRHLSWRQVAREAGVSASTVTRLQSGRAPDVDGFARLISWLGGGADRFLGQPGSAGCPECARLSAKLRRQRVQLQGLLEECECDPSNSTLY